VELLSSPSTSGKWGDPPPADRANGQLGDVVGQLGQLGQNVPAGKDEEVLTFHGDLGSSVLGVDDGIADLDVDRDQFSRVFSAASGAYGENFALLGLLFGGIGDDQAGRGGLFRLAGPDDDPVFERVQLHLNGPPWHSLLH
jgi:hypothetical protein